MTDSSLSLASTNIALIPFRLAPPYKPVERSAGGVVFGTSRAMVKSSVQEVESSDFLIDLLHFNAV
ncbi:MAG: hypothetical protein ACSHXD_20175, partial [Marinosulfonomonas sp.]